MVKQFKIFNNVIESLITDEIYVNSIIQLEYYKNELFDDDIKFIINIFNKNIRIIQLTIDIDSKGKYYMLDYCFKFDELLEYFKKNLIWIYIDSLYKHYIQSSDYLTNITNKEILEQIIINNIKKQNFDKFFTSLPLIYQQEYDYLINANKFDLI